MASSLNKFSEWELYKTQDVIPTTFSCRSVTLQFNFEWEVDPNTETQ